ncbi:hypothetical protein EUX98_g6569 [Antrodiella citrinella]|uniref:Uncharacterized protein n=1 Tax=Antrodiella citrinella TaxID=2447956 RepID=A0A4S4MPF7_9APHY|nr:hypothetical protein EUX98_g6569 [Antrodiella citrinella]
MNSLWNLIDWLLPSIRLTDDLTPNHAQFDPEALSATSHHNRYSLASNYSSYNSSLSHLHNDGNAVVSSYPPRRAAVAPQPSTQQQEVVASNRGGAPEWQRERDRKEREREHREREKDRIERERMVLKQQGEADGLRNTVKALQAEVDRLNRDLRISKEDSQAIQKISSQDYVPSPNAFPAVPPSDPLALRSAYDSLYSMHTFTHDALMERTEELASLKSFLSQTDDWSGAQLIQALRDLNTEIVHLAASLADELTSPSSSFASYCVKASASPKTRELVGGMVGPGMTNWLLGRDYTEDAATVLQFAIQAWEVSCIGRAMDSFSYGLPREVDQFLTRMFEHMHRTEPQPTTSRWRALTYDHARSLLSSSSSHHSTSPFQTLTDHNARGLLSMLALCNFPALPREVLLTRYGAHLARISERAERLASAVREGVMSASFDVMWVRPAECGKEGAKSKRFDDVWMEDVYESVEMGDERGSGVMCTVEFGLMLVRKSSAPEKRRSEDDGGHGHSTGHNHLPNGFVPVGNGHAGMSNGHSHNHGPPMNGTNGHAMLNGNNNGVNGGGHEHEGGKSFLTRTVLVKPRVLLDSVALLV